MGDKYINFNALAEDNSHGTDYRITLSERNKSRTAIVAPHGGSIERRTSDIARAIAGDEFSLYLFEGIDENGTFDSLHITSHRFDEPRCLELVATCETVITVHGCVGKEERIYLGGRDDQLKYDLADALDASGVDVNLDEHQFQGKHKRNICNRGATGRGVQIEFSDGLRGADNEMLAIDAIRRFLLL